MTKTVTGDNTTAPLRNVSLCLEALESSINRPSHLPGIVGFAGQSGLGKSFSAAYAVNMHRAYYIECRSTWTRKSFLLAALKSMGIEPGRNISEMTDQVSEELSLSERPFIIDEFDYIVDKGMVDLVRDIFEGSQSTILIIGEENVETKLQKKWKRFHNRMLSWYKAQIASMEDVQHLSRLYSPDITITDDLLAHLNDQCDGVVRLICININKIQEEARSQGLDTIDFDYVRRKRFEVYTGRAPRRGR